MSPGTQKHVHILYNTTLAKMDPSVGSECKRLFGLPCFRLTLCLLVSIVAYILKEITFEWADSYDAKV